MNGKVLINLATGMEDAERVLVAFLVATAAVAQGKQVVVWTTKDAVRLGLPGEMAGVPCKGCPPWSVSSSSSPKEEASFGYAPSASALGNSTTRRRSPTPRLWAPPPSGNGQAATQRCSATELRYPVRTHPDSATQGLAVCPSPARRANACEPADCPGCLGAAACGPNPGPPLCPGGQPPPRCEGASAKQWLRLARSARSAG